MWNRRSFLAALGAPALASADAPENWPQFRGPESLGVSADDPRLPETWSKTENVAWRTPLPGVAWASPVVWGDQIFVTNCISEGKVEPLKKGLYFGGNREEIPADPHRWTLHSFDITTGKQRWQAQIHRGVPKTSRHLKNSYASETPVTDGERVYVHLAHLGTFCYDMAGKPVWSVRWPPHQTRYGWGTSASPALHGARLYLVNDNEDQSLLIALDKTTGKEIWRVERDEPSNWATPYVWESGERTEIITNGKNRVRSYDEDGKQLWELAGSSSIVIPTPFSGHGLLYVASGYVGDETRPVFAIRPGAKGDISLADGQTSNQYIQWRLPQGAPYNPSPLLYRGLYYTLYDRGFLTCHDALSGEEVYGKQRFRVGASAFTASPWAYNGKLFCLSEDGDCFVIQAGKEFQLIRENSLGELSMATPAIAQGNLILRTAEALYRITNQT